MNSNKNKKPMGATEMPKADVRRARTGLKGKLKSSAEYVGDAVEKIGRKLQKSGYVKAGRKVEKMGDTLEHSQD